MKTHYQRFIRSYIALSERRPLTLLAVFLIVALVGLILAADRIHVETDLAALLPEGTDSVLALEMSESRIGSIDYFTIAIESPQPNKVAIAALQDRLKERIETEWEDAVWVQIARDTSFFRKHALYYLDRKDLLELLYRLEDELTCASSKTMPGMIDLLDCDEETDSLESWYNEDIPRRMGLPSQVCRSFSAFFDSESEETDESAALIETGDFGDRLISAEGDVGVVLVKLAKPSTDIDYAKEVLARTEALLASIDPARFAPGMHVEVVGAYRKFMEIEAIARDGQRATLISVALVLLLLFLFFRSFRTILVVFLPLLVAACVTMGIVALTYERLTVLTVFILALLVGMGIDYGIHLFGRIKQETRAGRSLSDAVYTSLHETGRALLVAAVTTIAALLVLLVGHFEGFREFGVVASFGLAVCAACAMLVIPPLVFVIERVRRIDRSGPEPEDSTLAIDRHLFGLAPERLFRVSFVLTLCVVALLSFFAPDTQFEYDIRNIMSPATESPIDFMRAIGSDSGTAPSIMLGESREQLEEAHDYLLKKLVEDQDEALMSFITYRTFVPSMDAQVQRQKIIRQIGALTEKKALRDLDGEKGRLIQELREMTQAQPFDHTALPDWALRIMTEESGEIGRIGHIYANIDEWNVYSGQDFQERYGALMFRGSWLPIASSRFILSDIVRMVKSDGLRLLVVVSLVLMAILYGFTRRVRATLVLFGVLAVGGLWTAGIIGLLDVRLSLYNIIVIPVILGIGIDGAIHLYHKHRNSPGSGVLHVIRTAGLTVSASSVTTMAGFVGLLFVEHKGLQTIGQLGVIGIAASWLAVMLLMPFLLPFSVSRKEKKEIAS